MNRKIEIEQNESELYKYYNKDHSKQKKFDNATLVTGRKLFV